MIKTILVIIMIGAGTSTVPNTHSIIFDSKDACESAKSYIDSKKFSYVNIHAFCTRG